MKKFIFRRKNKIVCYTYISNQYDCLKEHSYVCPDWDYVCFTNNKKLLKQKQIGVWKIEKSQFEKLDPKRNSGWHKTHPHVLLPKYNKSLWIDSNIDVLTDYLENIIKTTTKKLFVPVHYERDCIYDEIKEVNKINYDTPEKCDATYEFLKSKHMPEKYGLNETNIMLRHHNDKTIKSIDKMWWDCIKRYSKRDQLSFSYCLFKHNIKVKDISFPNARIDTKNYLILGHNYTLNKQEYYEPEFKIFKKEITPSGRRHIYFCGIKIASYKVKNTVSVDMFKSDIMKFKAFQNADNIKTIVLGSSHGRDGFVPDINSFNLGNSSQDLYRAYKIYEYITKNKTKRKYLKNIVLFWSVFHPGLQLEKTQEFLKCVPYKAFYNAEYPTSFPINDKMYIKALKKEYKNTKCPDNYRGESFYDVLHTDITSELVEKHLKNTKRNNNQIQYVKNMLDLTRKYKHNLYIVLPPYRQDYLDCLPDDKEIYFELFDFLEKNTDVKLLNFQRDKDFTDSDFDSADHCNKQGAIKLTNKIAGFIKD